MTLTGAATVLVLVLIVAKWGIQLWLDRLNQAYVESRRAEVPAAFKSSIDPATYSKSVAYTLAKGRLDQVETTYNAAVLLVILFSGLLPWAYRVFTHQMGTSAWAAALFLLVTLLVVSLPSLPLDWYGQFHVEQRFGFNTTTQKLWWLDRLKGLLLAVLLGYPLLVLILKLVDWTGNAWWIWAWAALLSFQLTLAVLAPVLILPLFNKFTPLPEGSLRNRLLDLASRTCFRARNIQIMDGSKRSKHSNAFFTGFGRFRKIVLFDTLIEQLAEVELEAVLAHEIGHFKKKHIPKGLLLSAFASLLGFYILHWLTQQDWFYLTFGFSPGNLVPVMLLFTLLSGVITFWFSPLSNWWSRRHEYEADAYAAEVMKEPGSLVNALRKLNTKNLSNLTPHPWYSTFYYSHPALVEREQALLKPT